MLRLASFALLLTACFSPLDNPDSNESKDRCRAHETIEACEADAACSAAQCPDCYGHPSFSGCFLANNGSPSAACPALTCADPCIGYQDESSCEADSRCVALTCPVCGGSSFIECADKLDAPIVDCEPPPSCPAACPSHTTDEACSADPGCYSVFQDPGTCDCAGAGCCMVFTRCETGSPKCDSTIDCSVAPMQCADGYLPIVIDSCTPACTHESQCPIGGI